ncbi:hypothetical protein P3T23_006310 [Paraburkholderia sp. GAS448]
MTFDGSAIKALLDDAVSKGVVHGVAAVVAITPRARQAHKRCSATRR